MKKEWLFIAIAAAVVFLGGGTLFVVQSFKTRKEFYDGLLPSAKQLEKETGISPDITLTQAAHETNFGQDAGLSKPPNYNLFGIKAGSSWTGRKASYTTHETIGGQSIVVKSDFRAYSSYLDSMRDWASLLVRLYPQAYQAAQNGDIRAFGEGLKKGKAGAYATDPNYTTALVKVHDAVEALA